MSRRSPLLLLLLLPPLALGALFWLGDGPRSPEDAAGVAQGAPAPEIAAAQLAGTVANGTPADKAAAGTPAAIGLPPASGDRRVGLGTPIEGRVTFADGAVPGGQVVVLASTRAASWGWEGAGRRILAGLPPNFPAHGFADADGRFALEWPGDEEELVLAALAPTAATVAAVTWRRSEGGPVTLTLEPRAALYVDVEAGPGFVAGERPNFHTARLSLGRPERSPGAGLEFSLEGEAGSGWDLGSARQGASGSVDQQGRAAFFAVAVGQEWQLTYDGAQAAHTTQPVEALASGEQRTMTLELGAGTRIVGRLVDESGTPVAEAEVGAHGAGPFGMPGARIASAKTDLDGRFELPRVSRAARALVLSKTSYLVGRSALADDLADGEQLDLGELVMEQGVRLTGLVRHADGRPAAGAEVSAEVDPMSLGQSGGMTAWRGFRTQSTADDGGHFALSGLTAGARYDLVATSNSDGQTARGSQKGVREGQGELVLVLEPAPVLSGRVLTPDGQPKAGAEVHAKSENRSPNAWMPPEVVTQSVYTDEEGNFELELEEAGAVSLEARAEGFAPSEGLAIEAPSDVVFELRLRPSLSVVGLVVDAAGQPVEGATVGKASTFLERMQSAGDSSAVSATSDAKGRFQLADLPEGEFVLHARHPEHTVSTNVTVELLEGQGSPEVVLTLRRGALLRGVLFDKGERAGAGVQIIATAMPELETRMAATDGAGEFVFERLIPGRWQVVSMGGFDMSGEAPEGGMASILESLKMQLVEVEDGLVYDVELGAPPKNPVTVRGVVRQGKEPISRGMLTFVPQEAGYAGMKIASVDSSGRYEIVLPEPGSYLVTAGTGDMGGPGNAGNQVELRCEVPKGESFEYDIKLPGGAIRGRVRGPDGQAVVGTMVTWSREDGLAVGTMMGGGYGAAQTDDRGHYELTLLAPGRYRIAAGGNNFGGMLDESPTTARGLRTGVELGLDEVREGVDFELAAPGEVRGRVRDTAGKPVSTMAVFARDVSGAPVETMSFVQSDPSGNFRWRGLAPGDYTFHARGNQQASAESARIQVRAGEVAEVELIVAEGAYLIVRVDGAEPLELAQGLVRVDVRDGDDRQVGGLFSMEDLTNLFSGNRSFDEQRFGPLPPGSYRASATGPDGNRVERRVELSPGQERRLRLRLKD